MLHRECLVVTFRFYDMLLVIIAQMKNNWVDYGYEIYSGLI